MVVIDSIKKGIVIDHIYPGRGMLILEYLHLDLKNHVVALIMNAVSRKNGRKDIIKIENIIDVDLAVIGLIDPGATVNVIEDHIITKKIKLSLPETVENVILCKNPRCVTSEEPDVPQIFRLVDGKNHEYKCEYCDDIVSMKGE